MAEVAESKRAVRKGRTGTVVSKSGTRTVVVEVHRRKQHPLYGKTVKLTKKYHAHDEKDTARVGDKVNIIECRPVSRMKRWRVVESIEK